MTYRYVTLSFRHRQCPTALSVVHVSYVTLVHVNVCMTYRYVTLSFKTYILHASIMGHDGHVCAWTCDGTSHAPCAGIMLLSIV